VVGQTRTRIAPLAIALAVLAAGALAWLAVPRHHARAASLHATPTDFAKVFAAAKGGETILLAPGNYGSFAGAVKPAVVTIRAQQRTTARMSLRFAAVANLRIEGLTIDGADIAGRSHDVTIAHSRFRQAIVIHADRMARAGVVLDGNRFAHIDVCPKCYEGRVQIVGDSGRPSGIVVRNNTFGPGGNADGIQDEGNAVQILDNTFTGIRQGGPHSRHSDALQLYGQRNTVVRGNYFRHVATAIMAPDGGDHELIEHNVFDTGSYPYAIMLGGDDGSVIRHNTLPDLGGCAYDLPCGTLLIGPGPKGDPSRGTVVQDNVLGQLSLSGGSTLGTDRHNLIATPGGGPADRVGRPVLAGGAHPASRSAFALAGGSPGTGAASDGTDVGIAQAAPRQKR
jgi:hypothetical protein